MTKSNVIAIKLDREAGARECFSNYLQSIAFNLTLSKQMIAGLQMIRDYWVDAVPMPSMGSPNYKSPRICQMSHTYTVVQSLTRRGLVYFIPHPKGDPLGNHQSWKLTTAGNLVCELLVEAGLMMSRTEVRKAKRA